MSFRAIAKGGIVASVLGLVVPACSSAGYEEDANGTQSLTAATVVTYFVVYGQATDTHPTASVFDTSYKAAIVSAGGALVSYYEQIGVAIVTSTSTNFATAIATASGVTSVSKTLGLAPQPNASKNIKAPATKLATTSSALTAQVQSLAASATPPEPYASWQWNMDQIHAGESNTSSFKGKGATIAVMDSGVDNTLPDLKDRVVGGVTCIGGRPNLDPKVWSHDTVGHGTHVAGILAASKNGVGVVGVAPEAKLFAVKLTDDGFIYPETFVCGVIASVLSGAKVINASIYTDPWYYTCPSDPKQKAILEAEQRVVNFARAAGVTMIVAASNENQDLDHPTVDNFSPTDGATVVRNIDNSCKFLPVELNGVIGVSAVGPTKKISYYSNYGKDAIDITGPGGDLNVLPTDSNPTGQILSDIPNYSLLFNWAAGWNGRVAKGCKDANGVAVADPNDPSVVPTTCTETYALLQGTSMSAPHVTGVAALALGRNPNLTPDQLYTKLTSTAQRLNCPNGSGNSYSGTPAGVINPAETCVDTAANSASDTFYGAGEVDAAPIVQ